MTKQLLKEDIEALNRQIEKFYGIKRMQKIRDYLIDIRNSLENKLAILERS